MSQAAQLIAAAVRPRLQHRGKPLLIGLCGSQGSGKSTLCRELARHWAGEQLLTAVLSLDDLYLTRAERECLRREVHPLLATRGPPGTHDVKLGIATLKALGSHARVRLPRFDKANDERCPQADWHVVAAPVDVILFEGWCVGARPQSRAMLVDPVNALESTEDVDGRWRTYVNERLADEYQTLFALIDVQVLLAAPGFDVVLKWRTQQERELRAQTEGPAVMDDVALARFIQHYERLTRHILCEMPSRVDLLIPLDEERRVRC